ncbi:dihydrofolate reductase [Endogone sp. FLAS-F59071]|nr:dihydrofolate reductase [Endogone sp. FLAS-F59071]|eukprot:RUS19645.1 dihydrofolate reductase [Endogone sp. FLAS-F59071]
MYSATKNFFRRVLSAMSSSPVNFSLVVAASEDNGIGLNNNLPWRIPPDQVWFKRVTSRIPKDAVEDDTGSVKQNAVIMGRLTWESVPVKMRPLSGRVNIILSRNPDYLNATPYPPNSVILASSLPSALSLVDPSRHPRTYIVGGAQIYREALAHPGCEHILLTRVHTRVECDTFLPDLESDPRFRRTAHDELVRFAGEEVPEGIQTYKGTEYEFMMYSRVDGGEEMAR